MKLHPFDETAKRAFELVDNGMTVHQQFNCQHCGEKQTMEESNRFFTRGICEKCGQETDIRRNGCNFMVAFVIGRKAEND